MHRLLVTPETLAAACVTLPAEAARHLKVLRPKSGEEIELFDGQGATRRYHWNAANNVLENPDVVKRLSRPRTELTLFACVTKGSRWDWTIEKAVELGVTRIVPVISDRSIVRLTAQERPAKALRWQRIAEDAARQSDAVWLPEIVPAVDFNASLAYVKSCDHVFIGALMTPPPLPLYKAVAQVKGQSFGLFVGPEGDFTPEELARLLAVAEPVSLGPTILRAETAAIYGLSVLAAARYAN